MTSWADDPEAVEELCNCGQVEELVVQADNEMKVMDMYLRNRWWELVKPVDIEYNPSDEDGASTPCCRPGLSGPSTTLQNALRYLQGQNPLPSSL